MHLCGRILGLSRGESRPMLCARLLPSTDLSTAEVRLYAARRAQLELPIDPPVRESEVPPLPLRRLLRRSLSAVWLLAVVEFCPATAPLRSAVFVLQHVLPNAGR